MKLLNAILSFFSKKSVIYITYFLLWFPIIIFYIQFVFKTHLDAYGITDVNYNLEVVLNIPQKITRYSLILFIIGFVFIWFIKNKIYMKLINLFLITLSIIILFTSVNIVINISDYLFFYHRYISLNKFAESVIDYDNIKLITSSHEDRNESTYLNDYRITFNYKRIDTLNNIKIFYYKHIFEKENIDSIKYFSIRKSLDEIRVPALYNFSNHLEILLRDDNSCYDCYYKILYYFPDRHQQLHSYYRDSLNLRYLTNNWSISSYRERY